MSRRRPPRAALMAVSGLLAGVLSGCTGDDARDRSPGEPITGEEAAVLASLLHRNYQRGGADFVITAPYERESVLTLTGEVDFRGSQGRAAVVTAYGEGRDDRTATVAFTPESLWFGDLPGLPEALAAQGAADAGWLRRPTSVTEGAEADLVDVLVATVLELSSPRADDPSSFGNGWTWQGQRSIDSRLSTLYGLPDGGTVAVDAVDSLLLQFVTPMPGADFEATITLSGHGRTSVALPDDEATAEAADHADVAASIGL